MSLVYSTNLEAGAPSTKCKLAKYHGFATCHSNLELNAWATYKTKIAIFIIDVVF
jgi:hypothetical protein